MQNDNNAAQTSRAEEAIRKITGGSDESWKAYTETGDTWKILSELNNELEHIERMIGEQDIPVSFFNVLDRVYTHLIEHHFVSAAEEMKKKYSGKIISVSIERLTGKNKDEWYRAPFYGKEDLILSDTDKELDFLKDKIAPAQFESVINKVYDRLGEPFNKKFSEKYGKYIRMHSMDLKRAIKENILPAFKDLEPSFFPGGCLLFLPPVKDIPGGFRISELHKKNRTGTDIGINAFTEHLYIPQYGLVPVDSKTFSFSDDMDTNGVIEEMIQFMHGVLPAIRELADPVLFYDHLTRSGIRVDSARLVEFRDGYNPTITDEYARAIRLVYTACYLGKSEAAQMVTALMKNISSTRWAPVESDSDDYNTYNRENNEYDEQDWMARENALNPLRELQDVLAQGNEKVDIYFKNLIKSSRDKLQINC